MILLYDVGAVCNIYMYSN